MAFVAGGPQQSFATVKEALKQRGYDALDVEEILGNVKHLPLNPREDYVQLLVFIKYIGNIRSTDIVVFDELPLDLTVVAGTLAREPQVEGARRFADAPVHLTVGKTGYTIGPTTDAVVRAKLVERTRKPWRALPVVAEKDLVRYDDMCPTLSPRCTQNGDRFGGRKDQPGSPSAKVGYDLVPFGFAIPVQWYRDFVDAPENASLKAKIDELVMREKTGALSPNERAVLALDVQNAFYTAKVPATQLAAVDAEIARLKTLAPAMEKMKFRSSANAEDIPNFDGAGLHDSFSVKRRRDQARDQAEDPAVRHQGPVEHARYRGASLRVPRSRDGELGHRGHAGVRRGEPGGRERRAHHALRQQRAAREQPRHEPRSRHHLADDVRHLQRRRPPYPLHEAHQERPPEAQLDQITNLAKGSKRSTAASNPATTALESGQFVVKQGRELAGAFGGPRRQEDSLRE